MLRPATGGTPTKLLSGRIQHWRKWSRDVPRVFPRCCAAPPAYLEDSETTKGERPSDWPGRCGCHSISGNFAYCWGSFRGLKCTPPFSLPKMHALPPYVHIVHPERWAPHGTLPVRHVATVARYTPTPYLTPFCGLWFDDIQGVAGSR